MIKHPIIQHTNGNYDPRCPECDGTDLIPDVMSNGFWCKNCAVGKNKMFYFEYYYNPED